MKNLFILPLMIGLVAGFAICQLLHSDCFTDQPSVAVSLPALEIKKIKAQTADQFLKKEDSLKKENQSLQKSLRDTKGRMNELAKKSNRLQGQVYALIDRQKTDKSISDTIDYIRDCDSLQQRTAEFLEFTDTKDSIQSVLVKNLEQQIENRDSVILVKEDRCRFLDSTLNQSLAVQQSLEQENKKIKKKLRRQKFGNKLKSAGLLVLTGLAASQLLK